MWNDPEILPLPPVPPPDAAEIPAAPPRRIPNIGHTILFFTVAIVVLLLVSVSTLAIAMGFHLMGTETPEQLLREPRLLIPSMAAGYLIAGAILWAVFTFLWRQPFSQGLHWNFSVVRRRWVRLLIGGVALSVVVQLLSNYLPVPKSLPIDDFFRTPGDVWLVALFGTFLAPLFEELAFRGFLLPSLASAWDWLRGQRHQVAPPIPISIPIPIDDSYVSPVTPGCGSRSALERGRPDCFLHPYQHRLCPGPRRSAGPRLGAFGCTVLCQPGALWGPPADPVSRRQHINSRHL